MMTKTILSAGKMVQRETMHPAADPKALSHLFLIANPRLEMDLTHRKESPLRIPNREWIAIFHPHSLAYAAHHVLQAGPGSSLVSHLPAAAGHSPLVCAEEVRRGGPRVTAFLIYCAAIRNPRKALKT
jgi:hypothetical protein